MGNRAWNAVGRGREEQRLERTCAYRHMRARCALRSAVWGVLLLVGLARGHASGSIEAAELTVRIDGEATFDAVGLVRRWDALGLPLQKHEGRVQLARPDFSVRLTRRAPGLWRAKVPEGVYDLCLVSKRRRVRLEGFHYPPVIDFDPVWVRPPEAPAGGVRALCGWIRRTRFYENKVTPLFAAGDKKAVRVLVQLLRDERTSYDALYGEPVATLRYEFWQFTHRLGVWDKEKRTRLVVRTIVPRAELRRWTWLWSPELGGIQIKGEVDRVLTVLDHPRNGFAGLLPGCRPVSMVGAWRTPDATRGELP